MVDAVNLISVECDKYIISEADLERVIIINIENISPKIQKIKAKDKEMFIENGRQAVMEFFKN